MRRWRAGLAAAGLVLAGCSMGGPTRIVADAPLPDLALREGMVLKVAPAVAGLDPRTVHLGYKSYLGQHPARCRNRPLADGGHLWTADVDRTIGSLAGQLRSACGQETTQQLG